EISPKVTEMIAYGVDAEGTGFAVFPPLDGHPLTGGNVELSESERRFVAAVKLVDALHQNDLVCGDLCESSFWLGRNGEVRFFGVMGVPVGQHGAEANPPVGTLPYLAPELIHGGAAPNKACDVFA